MRSLINLKGLNKLAKLDWVKKEKLENYFLDIDTIRKMYSNPDLLSPGNEVLGKSYSDLVFKRYVESLCIKMNKGCLVVIDTEECVSDNTIEILSLIFGYKIFYVVWDIPQDYLIKPRKYTNQIWEPLRQAELQKNVENFLNLQIINDKINHYQDILDYWKKENKKLLLEKNDRVLHVSDLHSNYTMFMSVLKPSKYKYIIFHGDYIDGPEEGGSKKILDELIKNNSNNVIWLEGNHEIRIRKYLGWIMLTGSGKKEIRDYLYSTLPKDFLNSTAKEFSSLTPEEAEVYLSELNKKLKLYTILESKNSIYVCTHSGYKWINQIDPRYIGNVVYGNRDMNRFDREFSEKNKNNKYWSIHAHCKYPDSWEVNRFRKVINIDPQDENEIVCGEQQNGKWKIWQLQRK